MSVCCMARYSVVDVASNAGDADTPSPRAPGITSGFHEFMNEFFCILR